MPSGPYSTHLEQKELQSDRLDLQQLWWLLKRSLHLQVIIHMPIGDQQIFDPLLS